MNTMKKHRKIITVGVVVCALAIALCMCVGCSSSQTSNSSSSSSSTTTQQTGREAIQLTNEVKSVGPYTEVVRGGDMLYCTAQAGQDSSGKIVKGGVAAQTTQILKNCKDELEQAGSSLDDVVKVTVYIKDMDDFKTMNKAYAAAFNKPYPARTCIEVEEVPFEGADLTIDMQAYSPK